MEIAIAITDALDKAHSSERRPSRSQTVPTSCSPVPGRSCSTSALAKTNAAAEGAMTAAAKSGLTVPGMLIGTLQYMRPEQLEGGDAARAHGTSLRSAYSSTKW
jgi:hypothetical protein